MPFHLNEPAILVTALLAMAIGSIWYSPLLFGMEWMKAAGVDERGIEHQRKRVIPLLLLGIAVHALFFGILSFIIAVGINQGYSFLPLALLLIALCATLMVCMTVWENRSARYFYIHMGYMALVILGGSAVIHYWPW